MLPRGEWKNASISWSGELITKVNDQEDGKFQDRCRFQTEAVIHVRGYNFFAILPEKSSYKKAPTTLSKPGSGSYVAYKPGQLVNLYKGELHLTEKPASV